MTIYANDDNGKIPIRGTSVRDKLATVVAESCPVWPTSVKSKLSIQIQFPVIPVYAGMTGNSTYPE